MSNPTSQQNILHAMVFARHAHYGQTRSSAHTTVPYFMHCVDVVALLAEHAADETHGPDVYTAAFLHDVVEDTKHTLADIKELFGSSVAYYVELLTLPSDCMHMGPKKTAWQVATMRQTSTPNLVRAVKIADKTSNVRDMIRYPPDWLPEDIRSYTSSALEVVQAAMETAHDAPLIHLLHQDFMASHKATMEHYHGA